MTDPVMRDLDRHLDAIDAADRRAYILEGLVADLTRGAVCGLCNDKVIEWDCAAHERTYYDTVVEIITRAHRETWAGKSDITLIREAWSALCRQWAEHEAPRMYEECDQCEP